MKLEVHAHSYVASARPAGVPLWEQGFDHAHGDGNDPHQHEFVGPASYTIDKDEWFATTGMRGGGRKKFAQRPKGPQFPRVELDDHQRRFTVVFVPISAADVRVSGMAPVGKGGGAAVARMALTFGMDVDYVYEPLPNPEASP